MLPDHGFIGAEPFLNGVATALGHVRDKHLANVRLWRGDALDVLQRVPDGALSFLYLLHPDPWPKARHAKRRMVNDGPVDLFAAKLKPGGEFRLATDDPTYLTWSLMVMQRHVDAVRMARRDARRTSSSRRAAGSRPATAPSRGARAAGLIICATSGFERRRRWTSIAGPCSAAPQPCRSRPPPSPRAPADDYWERIAREYDVTREVIQLEHGNWGMMARPVLAAYRAHVERVNRDTSYYARRTMVGDLEAARAALASAMGVGVDEIAFTRNATEAMKALILQYNRLKPGDAVLYADLDYDSMQTSMDSLARAARGASRSRSRCPSRRRASR